MNAKLNNEIAALLKEHKWQEVLRKLPPNEPIPLTFSTNAEMNNIRSVAARLNSMGEDKYRYSFSGLNYNTKTVCALATLKVDE
jgi:hypothetical protein